jgi:acetoin utilization protein AcuB
MHENRVVGVISATEIFELAAHTVGAWEKRNGLTLAPLRLGPGVLGRIADVAQAAGAQLRAIFPMASPEDEAEGLTSVVLRFRAASVATVAGALERAGFPVTSWSQQPAPELAA